MANQTELPDYRDRFKGHRQKGKFWCIPATISSMLTYFEIELSQADLVLKHCKETGDKALLASPTDHQTTSLAGMSDEQILRTAEASVLNGANFGVFSGLASRAVGLERHGVEFRVQGAPEATGYIDAVAEHIRSGSPVGVSWQNPDDTSHVGVALAADGIHLHCYDPAEDRTNPMRLETKWNGDFLVLESKKI